MRLHFSIGCSDCRRTTRFRQSIHFSRIQVLLLIMCIDAPESTTNSRSSGLGFDGAGRHLFSEGEKNAVLSFSFNFLNTFGQPSRCFTGTLLLPFRLLLRPILKFWSIGVTLMRFAWANHSERRIFVSNVSVTYKRIREFYASDRFPCV